jgi:protein-tyrosine phosphatase
MSCAVLLVCLGNICRSPTAHAVLASRIDNAALGSRVTVDSAGTGDWHVGESPDPRAIEAAARRGYDMRSLRARQVTAADFSRFDLILAMDRQNLRDLQRMRPRDHVGELDLFLRFRTAQDCQDVPDPYYGNADGFERVLDLIEEAADGLLDHLRRTRL